MTQSVIFCNTRKKVEWLSEQMKHAFFTVSFMHGQMPQKQREQIMKEFRNGKTRVMIVTDIWGRGIDVSQIGLVINYDIPTNREAYIHRIGRSGRFGRKGLALNFVTSEDIALLNDIEQFYGTHIEELPSNLDDLL